MHAMAGVALWGAIVVAVVAVLGGQQAYARGSLAWSLPAPILLDPLAAIPAARLLLGERLEPGHAAIWLPAAIVAGIGVVVLARTGEPARRAASRPPVGGGDRCDLRGGELVDVVPSGSPARLMRPSVTWNRVSRPRPTGMRQASPSTPVSRATARRIMTACVTATTVSPGWRRPISSSASTMRR